METDGMRRSTWQDRGYGVVHLLLAGIILVAAALKGHQLATEPILGHGLLDGRWFLIGVVEFELFFGLWLLLGAAPQMTWYATLACFSGFAAVSGYKGILGEASCGCFGKVAIHPWYTCILDLACVALLLVSRPKSPEKAVRRNSLRVVKLCGVLGLALGLPAAYAMVRYQAGVVAADGMIAGDGNLVVLTPEEWVGKPFPLTSHIDVGRQLNQGKWLVVLYHLGCPQCEELLGKYREMCCSNRIPGNPCQVAFIEVPEPGQVAKELNLTGIAALLGKMSNSREWFVPAPAVLLLEDGQVREASQGKAEAFFTLLDRVSPEG